MITGNQNPVVGKEEYYQVNSLGLPLFSNNERYVWKIYKKQKSGSWRDITMNPPKTGQRVPFQFGESVAGTEFRLEAWRETRNLLSNEWNRQKTGEMVVIPAQSKTAKITRVVLFNRGARDVNKANYSDTLIAQAHCVAMFNHTVQFQLWEDDAPGSGHDAEINKNNTTRDIFEGRVNARGIAEVRIPLSSNPALLQRIANRFLMGGDQDEGAHHEYYVTASSAGKIGGSSQTNVNVTNPGYKPKPREDSPKFPATSTSYAPEQPDSESKILDAYFVNGKNQKLTKAAVGNHVQVQIITRNMLGKHVQYKVWEYDTAKNDLVYESGRIEVKGDIINTSGFTLTQAIFDKGIDFGRLDPDSSSQNYFIEIIPLDVSAESKRFGVTAEALMTVETGKSAAVVRELKGEKIENIIDAYFAKKEYTQQTDEQDGTYTYTFANVNQNINKDTVAKIIKDKTDAALKSSKKYAKLETVKAALTKTSYAKGEKISFSVFKLGEEFKRINNAPLEDKVYLVAKAMLLDGKEATISIKEKDGIIKGSAGAVLPVLEMTEAHMNQTSSNLEVHGTEKTEFTGIIQDGMVKIPVQLRPKSDDDLKQWKEKLTKGKEDGSYTYTFAGQTSIPNGSGDEKKRIAGIILNNAKNGLRGNPPIENGKTAYAEEIENALTKEKYAQGETITFVLYKKQEELLYLRVKSKGQKQHDKEFLKQEGAYFEIDSKNGCLIDEIFFFTNYQKEFPQKDRNGNEIPLSKDTKFSLKKMFKSISEYYKNEQRCCDLEQVAYLLATAKHETGDTYNPVEEANWLSWNARKKYFEEMYDPVLGKNENRRTMAKDNENTQQGDGEKYFGRGYVQLTWKKNYRRMSEKFGVDFVNQRDKATEHEWAVKILIYGSEQGIFTGVSLSNYINDSKIDYVNARRVINGSDKASTIASYAEKIAKCLKIECNCEHTNEKVKDGYDIDKAVKYINANAEPSSKGKCALYVRMAINAGGITNLSGHAYEYYDTDKLVSKGFTKIGTNLDSITLKNGDIAAFAAVTGHPYGHIAMWNGTQWVSDFKQRSFWVANQYSIEQKYAIYRWQ